MLLLKVSRHPHSDTLFSVLCCTTENFYWLGKHFSTLKSKARKIALAIIKNKIMPSF